MSADIRAERDRIRSAIFSGTRERFKKEVVTFFGEQIEIRQPKVRGVLSQAQDDEEEGRSKQVLTQLIENAFIPGTDVLVFEDTDMDLLGEQPFGSDFSQAIETMTRLMGVDVEDAKKELKANPTED